MAKKKHEYENAPVQFDQMLYLERIERQNELMEENNALLQKLVDVQAPKEEAKSKTTTKKATTTTEKDEPAEDKKGE